MNRFHTRATVVFGVLAIVLGVALLVETARAGGGSAGYLFGTLFLLLGAGRIYLARRR
ncbi:MAG TPA: hypothetical protein VFJ77_04975 [Gaiellaceae bacterium]|nr:hypothetical protein [Gaiellaceae bacterium]